ncbi:MAG: hypothetical protein FWF20_08170 [Betaproteobacteria bacterium]|nr:hypothetical protein [Betaproteobacteria bacterium]MCL2886740.1 hypothetical protein [Betaproteobacteria bacterium]
MNDEEFQYQWLGYGNIKSDLWFIGIEPGGENKGYNGKGCSKYLLENGSSFYLGDSLPASDQSEVFRRCEEVAESAGYGRNYFLSNMSPIASRGVDNHAETDGRLKSYQNLLYQAYKQYRPQAVVFHGKGSRYNRGFDHWGLGNIFDLANVERKGKEIVEFVGANILLCDNFSPEWNKGEGWRVQSAALSEKLRAWRT